MATDNSETSLQWRAWLDSEKVLNLTQCDTVLQNSEQSIEPKFRSTSRRFMQFLCKQQLTNTPAYTRFHCCVELSCLINTNCSITRGIQEVQPPADWSRHFDSSSPTYSLRASTAPTWNCTSSHQCSPQYLYYSNLSSGENDEVPTGASYHQPILTSVTVHMHQKSTDTIKETHFDKEQISMPW